MPFDRAPRRVLRMSASIAAIRAEARELFPKAASYAPVKVVANDLGMTPKNVELIRAGDHEPRWFNVIALAQKCPELRSLIARALALEQRDPQTEALLEQMRRWIATQPEEGDRNNE